MVKGNKDAINMEETAFSIIVGQCDKLSKEILKARKASRTDCNVLIFGEHGTGKELVARAIHVASNRRDKPFIKVNCAAIPDTLIETEFFGYEEGAFTGAKRGGKTGLFQQAHQGTLFLDEVGDLSLPAQAKLLTAIQDKEFTRIGSAKAIKVDVRIIAATNKDIRRLIREGRFREDLFYRLNVVRIDLPPLRERDNDIEILSNYFLHFYCKKMGTNKHFSKETLDLLRSYKWPGNVRELFNVIEYAIVMSDDTEITPKDLPPYIAEQNQRSKESKETGPEEKELRDAYRVIANKLVGKSWVEIRREIEKNILRTMLERFKTKSELIKTLKISRSQFYEKLKKLELEDENNG